MKKWLKWIVAGLISGALVLGAIQYFAYYQRPQPKTDIPQKENKAAPRIAVLAENLEIPWAIAFLPDKSLLVTERPGKVRLVGADGKLKSEPLLVLDDVWAQSEGGLLGIAVHPEFSKNRLVYLYYTYGGVGENTFNRVVRYRLEGDKLTSRSMVVDGIPGANNHNGGRIKFGPDRFLYIATGDAQEPSLAQDKNALAGKILRVTDDGKPAPGNPFGSRVYSYGHRNPQGLAWDSRGQLWATEHGQITQDEVNKITAGGNYGWPTVRGEQQREGMAAPVVQSGADTWAPSGTATLKQKLYFGGLRGQALFMVTLGEPTAPVKHFAGELGRVREVVVGPDGLLYITVSNRDGRGNPLAGDDKIYVVNPTKL
ncbi:MAG TPA: PQQ-dependent sugar dehydrogenase [Candidatus Dormibacteraeota bacterium]|nr:PQQ-dependent sugar dehydrogenase [Candidatus Dormibacteraeota bacterium]